MTRDKKPRLSKSEDPLAVKDVLDVVLKNLKIDITEERFQLNSAWAEIAGTDIALHVRVVDIHHKSLVLRADHPSWANVVMLKKKQLIKAVQNRYPALGITTLHILGA